MNRELLLIYSDFLKFEAELEIKDGSKCINYHKLGIYVLDIFENRQDEEILIKYGAFNNEL